MKISINIALSAAVLTLALLSQEAVAQTIDTASVYKDRQDSLDATVFVGHQDNAISKGKAIRTELISTSGLQKMACCNLAESFENSASVTVGYADAVTGARQIRLLGLSGVYTQMLDENRPVMRGITAPYGMTYIPGPWLESIQIAKGSPSVINGTESMTGQINMEFKKPTEEKPLFIQASMMDDSKTDFNFTSAWRIGESLYTILLGHASANWKEMDMNHDFFLDQPKTLQFNVANRWLLYKPNYQLRWGVRAVRDRRLGGQADYDRQDAYSRAYSGHLSDATPWGTDITNEILNGYVKFAVPLREDGSSSVAAILDYDYQDTDSWFGASVWQGQQHSGFVNLLYRNQINESHDFTVGLSGTFDRDFTTLSRWTGSIGATEKETRNTYFGGAYGEYTFHIGEKFTSIAGVTGNWYSDNGFKVAPRLTVKYAPAEWLVIRANGGRGLRFANPIADNMGVMSVHAALEGDYFTRLLEDSWTFGGNVTVYLPFGANPEQTYISFDYFRTQFAEQLLTDWEQENKAVTGIRTIYFYNLDKETSYSDNYQVDFNIEPFERFTVGITGRYTHAVTTTYDGRTVEKPMQSRYKALLNLQYKTRMDRWIFDFTAAVNGPSRVYSFMTDLTDDYGHLLYPDGLTPVYPMLYAQVTRRFKGFDVYLGMENITDYRQEHVIIGTSAGAGHITPWDTEFNAASVWGPLMGRRINLGVRMTIWRKTKQ